MKRIWPGNLPGLPAAITRNIPLGGVPTMELLTLETTQEEIMTLYYQVYQLKRSPREVPCLEDTVEETCMEILETLKEHLWHRQSCTQPESKHRQRISRTPAQVKFHTQMQAMYDHFGQLRNRQQESWEEALWIVRDAHCQALATVAMLEGHIEQLNCSFSCGQEVEGAQEPEAIQGAAQEIHQPKAMLGMLPRDGQTKSSQCDAGGGSSLSTAVWTPTQKQPPRQQAGHSL